VTRAAARLRVSQPPLRRQIRDLERELDVSLFDRSTRGVRLTEAGETFLVEARAVLQRADEAVDHVKDVALGKRGRVRVGHASGVLTLEVFRRALRSFSRKHPHVSVDLREMTTLEILRGLGDRTLDVALVVPSSPRDFEGLAVETLRTYPSGVATNIPRPTRRCFRSSPVHALAQDRRGVR